MENKTYKVDREYVGTVKSMFIERQLDRYNFEINSEDRGILTFTTMIPEAYEAVRCVLNKLGYHEEQDHLGNDTESTIVEDCGYGQL